MFTPSNNRGSRISQNSHGIKSLEQRQIIWVNGKKEGFVRKVQKKLGKGERRRVAPAWNSISRSGPRASIRVESLIVKLSRTEEKIPVHRSTDQPTPSCFSNI